MMIILLATNINHMQEEHLTLSEALAEIYNDIYREQVDIREIALEQIQ